MDTHSVVIDLAKARRSRGLGDVATAPAPEVTHTPEQVASVNSCALPPLFDEDLDGLTRKVQVAMTDWSGLEAMSGAELKTFLPMVISGIAQDPDMMSKTGISRLDRALASRFGDARLGRAALMTPQELLALEGVGETAFSQLIAELQKHPALSVPELISGRGKAGLQQQAPISDAFLEIASGMPGHQEIIRLA